ncbi:MAG: transporter [Microbacteriaceae bacterium]|nr:transporter [Microbacteriaceae bacterium]
MLAGAVFVAVTAEFVPTGLLPDMAHDLHVSESRIGLLVTVFAVSIVITTTPLVALTRRFSRKYLVVLVLLANAIAAGLAAIAQSYEVLLVARVLGGMADGLFWAVAGAYAAHLVAKERIGRAVAITSGGATAAFILGVPFSAAIGHALGWRLAFGGIAALMVVLSVLVLVLLPAVEHRVTLADGEVAAPLRHDRSIPGVVIVCLVIITIMTGQYIYYTYIAPWLIGVGGFSPGAIAPLLFVFGVAGAVGLVVVGLFSDRSPGVTVIIVTAVVLVSVAVLALFSSNTVVLIIAFAVWGAAFGAYPSLFQARLFHTASHAMRDLSGALFATSFNVAIGIGALLGGVLLDQSGLRVLPFYFVGFLAVAIVLSLVTDAWLATRAKAELTR